MAENVVRARFDVDPGSEGLKRLEAFGRRYAALGQIPAPNLARPFDQLAAASLKTTTAQARLASVATQVATAQARAGQSAALQTTALARLEAQASRTARELASVNRAQAAGGAGGGAAGFGRDLASQLPGIGMFAGAAGGVAAGLALREVGEAMGELVKRSEDLARAQSFLQNSARLAGQSFSDESAKARQLAIDFGLSNTEAFKLEATALRLSRVTGIDPTRIIKGLGDALAAAGGSIGDLDTALRQVATGQDEIFDRIASANPSQFYDSWAKANGRTADSLTDVEKLQIRVNAAIKIGEESQGAAAAQIGTTIGLWGQLTTAISNNVTAIGAAANTNSSFSVIMGSIWLQAFKAGIVSVEQFNGAMKSIAAPTVAAEAAANKFVASFSLINLVLAAGKKEAADLDARMKLLYGTLGKVDPFVGLDSFGRSTEQVKLWANATKQATEEVAGRMKGLALEIASQDNPFASVQAKFAEVIQAVEAKRHLIGDGQADEARRVAEVWKAQQIEIIKDAEVEKARKSIQTVIVEIQKMDDQTRKARGVTDLQQRFVDFEREGTAGARRLAEILETLGPAAAIPFKAAFDRMRTEDLAALRRDTQTAIREFEAARDRFEGRTGGAIGPTDQQRLFDRAGRGDRAAENEIAREIAAGRLRRDSLSFDEQDIARRALDQMELDIKFPELAAVKEGAAGITTGTTALNAAISDLKKLFDTNEPGTLGYVMRRISEGKDPLATIAVELKSSELDGQVAGSGRGA